MRTVVLMTMLALAACAARGSGREVAAVVQDEDARQAAVLSAQQGEGSEAALEAGAETAKRDKDVSEPPL